MAVNYYKAENYPTNFHGLIGIKPEVFVFHSTDGGSYNYLHGLFQGLYRRDDKVAVTVHFGLYKDGRLVEYAPWKKGECYQCWHAGASEWNGRTGVSAFSIGVEIQQSPYENYTDAQIEGLIFLVKMVKAEYPNIAWTTHKEISGRLQGKWDPYPPWETQVWPLLQKVINEPNGDGDMTPDESKWLRMLRVSSVADSYDRKIIKAMLANAPQSEIDQLEREKEKAVEAVRKEVGLS